MFVVCAQRSDTEADSNGWVTCWEPVVKRERGREGDGGRKTGMEGGRVGGRVGGWGGREGWREEERDSASQFIRIPL